MKRDMDLVRKIFIEVEKAESYDKPFELEVEGFSSDQVAYHLLLLKDAGLLEVEESSNWSATYVLPIRMTWSGTEFLAAARDDTRWNKAKEIAQEKGGGLMIDVLKGVLTQLARQAAGLP